MICIVLTGLLFGWLAIPFGFYLTAKAEGVNFQFSIFKSLLAGTAAITVYLNILSLFFKTDYKPLIPLLVLTVLVLVRTSFLQLLRKSISTNMRFLFKKERAIVTIAFLLPLMLFIFVAPYNTDSSGYHFLSILWNEKFKAVPGLANLFPQYGYNSSFFALSAAFSFTELFHQSIYPVNGVLVTCFFLWLLKKSYAYKDARRLIIWLILLVLLRQFPINLASPSADALASILVLYIFFSLVEIKSEVWQPHQWLHLLLLTCFAIIIKLSCVPLLLVAAMPLLIYKERKRIFYSYLQALLPVFLITIPWLMRNVILSGYLLYPFPSIDLFSFDWKVPVNIATAEKLHISYAPRLISEDFNYAQSLSFFEWFPTWVSRMWYVNHFNFLLVVASLFSPFFIGVIYFTKKLKSIHFLSWVAAYISICFWLVTSPDIRFGYHYMLPCMFIPLFSFAENKTFHLKRIYSIAAPVIIVIACFYYDSIALQMLQPYRLSQWIIRPLKSPEYYKNKDFSTFKYANLNNGIKLYIHDSTHHSINAPLPSCYPYREGIRMRGDKLDDGFKTINREFLIPN